MVTYAVDGVNKDVGDLFFYVKQQEGLFSRRATMHTVRPEAFYKLYSSFVVNSKR